MKKMVRVHFTRKHCGQKSFQNENWRLYVEARISTREEVIPLVLLKFCVLKCFSWHLFSVVSVRCLQWILVKCTSSHCSIIWQLQKSYFAWCNLWAITCIPKQSWEFFFTRIAAIDSGMDVTAKDVSSPYLQFSFMYRGLYPGYLSWIR